MSREETHILDSDGCGSSGCYCLSRSHLPISWTKVLEDVLYRPYSPSICSLVNWTHRKPVLGSLGIAWSTGLHAEFQDSLDPFLILPDELLGIKHSKFSVLQECSVTVLSLTSMILSPNYLPLFELSFLTAFGCTSPSHRLSYLGADCLCSPPIP